MTKLPLTVINYSGEDPRTTIGGVQTFARNLSLSFEKVEFMTRADRDFGYAIEKKIPVICDNQYVVDWPEGHPLIGFRHGVGAEKYRATRRKVHRRLARAQKVAAKRENTTWVACAQWVADSFKRLYGTPNDEIIYYPTDVDRFDGELDNADSRLILHDGRLEHKGSKLIKKIEPAFPGWQFEFINRKPEDVPDRMRAARAFIHLSRVEGNSVVCNEAMAMNLPCLFTTVGLMNDVNRPTDVFLIATDKAFKRKKYLLEQVGDFLASLDQRTYKPREWVLKNADPEANLASWRRAMIKFQKMSGWDLAVGN